MVLRSYHVLAPSKRKLIAHNEAFAFLDLFALVAVHGTRLHYITAPFFGILVWPEACVGWTGRCAHLLFTLLHKINILLVRTRLAGAP